MDRRAGARGARGRARHQAAQTRSGALLVRRSAWRLARQDLAGVGSRKRHAQWRFHDHDALGKRHLAQKRLPGVHRRRRFRHGGNGRRRRFRHDRRSDELPRAALGGKNRLAVVRYRFQQRQAGAVFHPRALPRRADRARQGRFRLSRRTGSRIPSVQAGERAAQPRRRHLAAASARGEPAQRKAISISPRRVTTCSIRR